ncbi:DUF998 domain-containing protein [Streptomyces sp. NPDC058308]|uniref:DUF998 domain-containing protein n=1 Tax=Streptomyces sp. NPDC058308 TaxID=3346440 RepID=UPI0036F0CA72
MAVPLGLAALLYNAWLLQAVVPAGLDARHSYVSELYAEGSPYRWLFGGLELSCAVLVVAGATAGGMAAAGSRMVRTGWWALAGVGVSSVADVLMPMTCAPSLEPDCRAVHPAHTLTSASVHFCLFASMTLIIWRARQRGCPELIARWGPSLGGAALISSLCTVGPLFGYGGWHGLAQRCHVLLVGAWLAMLACSAWAAQPGAAAAAGHPPAGRGLRGGAGRRAPDGQSVPPGSPLSPDLPPDRAV